MHRRPTVLELQAALDAQDFLGRLIISPIDPIEVQSDTPPLHEWRGQLDGKNVAFRIGTVPPASLPGSSKNHPSVRSWPLALWSTEYGQPDVVGAGAMAIHSWAAATRGATYKPSEGATFDLSGRKRWIDVVLTYHSGREDALRARYPDMPPDDPPGKGEPGTIEAHIR